MEVEHEVMARAGVGQSIHHLKGRLVVAIEKIDLESLHAHLGVMAASLLQLLINDVEHRPKDDAHMALVGVADEAGQVHVGDGMHDVALVGVVPSLIEDDVFELVLRCEVYII